MKTKPEKKSQKRRVSPQVSMSGKNPFAEIEWSQSYMSLLLGLAVVMAVGIVGFTLLHSRRLHMIQATSSTATVAQTQTYKKDLSLPKNYTVAAGDDLTKISEKYYQTPDKWQDIANANNIADPNYLPAGSVLMIPASASSKQQPSQSSVNQQGNITGTMYTVQAGDYVLDIAQRAYGDSNRAPDIISANNLSDPDHLEAGTVLKIPRP